MVKRCECSNFPIALQINKATSWIDGSFVYSTSEAWVAALRSFVNGSLRTDSTGKLPPRNAERVPLNSAPSPHVLRMLDPEKMFRE